MLIKKAFVNDRGIHEKKTLILQAEMEWIADTLFGHPVTEGQERQGRKGSQ
jgi:hypothetical protein